MITVTFVLPSGAEVIVESQGVPRVGEGVEIHARRHEEPGISSTSSYRVAHVEWVVSYNRLTAEPQRCMPIVTLEAPNG